MYYPKFTIDTSNPDPTQAISAFLWTMAKARELGMLSPTEHSLAEHLFRKDARTILYLNSGGICSLVMDDEALDDDTFEQVLEVFVRQRRRWRERAAVEDVATTSELTCEQCGGPRAVGSAKRCRACYTGRAPTPQESARD